MDAEQKMDHCVLSISGDSDLVEVEDLKVDISIVGVEDVKDAGLEVYLRIGLDVPFPYVLMDPSNSLPNH